MSQVSTFAPVDRAVGKLRGTFPSPSLATSLPYLPESTVARGRGKKKARAVARAFLKIMLGACLRIAPLASAQDQAGGEKCESDQDGHQQ